MAVSVKIKENSGYTAAVFSTRIVTAIDMLHYVNQLNIEQETEGEWDTFRSNLCERMAELLIRVDFNVEYFKGNSDVILELTVIIQPDKDFKGEVCDERIAGTILMDLCNHFGWKGFVNAPELKESTDSYRFKHLAVFKS